MRGLEGKKLREEMSNVEEVVRDRVKKKEEVEGKVRTKEVVD